MTTTTKFQPTTADLGIVAQAVLSGPAPYTTLDEMTGRAAAAIGGDSLYQYQWDAIIGIMARELGA